MDENKFSQALFKALDNDEVARKLSSIISSEIASVIQRSNKEMISVFEEKNNEMKLLLQEQTQEIKRKDEEIKNLKEDITKLEHANDALEQYTRRNSLRISGLADPEENYEDPVRTVLTLFNTTMKMEEAKCPIMITDIDRVHRVGPKMPGSSRPMLVKFANYRARQRVFKAKRALFPKSGTAGQSSTTTRNIFINEDLTRARVQLLYHARQAKKKKQINDCWTVDGQLLIKSKANKVTPIHNHNELERITQ